MTATAFAGFDDLGDDFDTAPVVANLPATMEDASKNKSVKAAPEKQVWVENCAKCGGSGTYRFPSSLGHCHCTKCKGTGKITYKSSPAAREKNRVNRHKNERTKLQQKVDAFKEAHPAVWGWIENSGTYPFAMAMRESILFYGSLTERQLAACYKTIDSVARARKEREEIAEKAKENGQVSVDGVKEAMHKAKGTGIKKPKMRLSYGTDGEMIVYEAAQFSNNAGSLYVKSTCGLYLGKITEGVFYRSRDVIQEIADKIVLALQTPLESAKLYGKRTGTCSCCGRQLDNAVSIELGIGPICLGKYF